MSTTCESGASPLRQCSSAGQSLAMHYHVGTDWSGQRIGPAYRSCGPGECERRGHRDAERRPAGAGGRGLPPGDRGDAAERTGRRAVLGPGAAGPNLLRAGLGRVDPGYDAGLYAQWERWASDVAESHTTYLQLVRFRSPQPLSSWVTSLLSVLDSAALFLALSPTAAPVVPARLCLRSGFLCFNRIARAMGFDIPAIRTCWPGTYCCIYH